MSSNSVQTPSSLGLRSRVAFLFKDAVLYGGAAAISKAFALLTFPLLARYFTVAEYGVVDFFSILVNVLAVALIFGQDSAVARYFYEHEDTLSRCQLISQSLIFQLAVMAILLPMFWLGSSWLSGFLVDVPQADLLFKLVLLQAPFLVLISFAQGILKWTFKRAKFLAMSVGFTVVQALSLVFALLVLRVDLQGVLWAGLFSSVCFASVGLFFIREWLVRPAGCKRLLEILPFAIPYGVICVLGAFIPMLERSMTDQLLGAEKLGLYAVGAKLAMVLGLVVGAFQTAWGPFSLSIYKQADAAQTYNFVLKFFALGICLIVLLLTLIAPGIIDLLVSDRYAGAVVVVFPLVMGLAIQATSWITEIGIGISKRSYLNLNAYFVFAGVTLGSILLLAPLWGVTGVAAGVLAGQIAKALVSSWLAQRAHPFPWQYRSVLSILILTLVIGVGAEVGAKFWGSEIRSTTLAIGIMIQLFTGWRVLLTTEERKRVVRVVSSRVAFLRF